MRLIDVDKIVFYTPRWSDGEGLFTKWLKETLKNAPTVEAIPIEWLKEHIVTIEQNWILEDWEREHETDRSTHSESI